MENNKIIVQCNDVFLIVAPFSTKIFPYTDILLFIYVYIHTHILTTDTPLILSQSLIYASGKRSFRKGPFVSPYGQVFVYYIDQSYERMDYNGMGSRFTLHTNTYDRILHKNKYFHIAKEQSQYKE